MPVFHTETWRITVPDKGPAAVRAHRHAEASLADEGVTKYLIFLRVDDCQAPARRVRDVGVLRESLGAGDKTGNESRNREQPAYSEIHALLLFEADTAHRSVFGIRRSINTLAIDRLDGGIHPGPGREVNVVWIAIGVSSVSLPPWRSRAASRRRSDELGQEMLDPRSAVRRQLTRGSPAMRYEKRKRKTKNAFIWKPPSARGQTCLRQATPG